MKKIIKMQIAVITDTHFGIKNDAAYMLDYQEKFYKNVFFPYLSKNNIKNIIHLGDLFDRRKYINFMTLNRTKEMFLDRLRDLNISMTIIPGNHDTYHKNTNEVNSLTQLLGEYSNISVVETPFKDAGFDIAFIPWINQENQQEVMEFVQSTQAPILCGHLELQGFEMHMGVKNEHGMDAKLFEKFEQVWTGHFHHKSSKGNVHYLGSPMEFTFADYADAKGFHVFDTEKKTLTFQPNPYTLYDKIFYNDETDDLVDHFRTLDCSKYSGKNIKLFVVKKSKPAIFEYFLDNLTKQDLVDLSIMEDYSNFEESNVDLQIQDQSTKDLMDIYVDSVETEMDKERLKSILNNIYIEALHVSV